MCPFIHEMKVKFLNDFKKITHTHILLNCTASLVGQDMTKNV